MSIAATKQKTLMRRRKTAIIIAAALTLVLAIALVLVLDYARTLTFEDVDGTPYYIRKRNGVFAMYDGDRTVLPYDEQYSCYVTGAGTLVEVDPETGLWEIYAVVDTEAYEVVGVNSRILMFPHVKKENILSIEVHNAHGVYTFIRYNEKNEADPSGRFVLQSSPLTSFSPEKFTSLHVGAGYTISLRKLTDPIVDANGEYTEYGLVPETRVKTTDEQGNELAEPIEYAYEPTYYILTQTDGTRHKVLIGDKLLTDEGYYAQYVELKDGQERKLPGVYVLDMTTGQHLNYAVEEYVSPMLSYPMSTSNYYDVEDFIIAHRKDDAMAGEADPYSPVISFTYVDLALRQGTVKETAPYEFHLDLEGFTPTTDSIDACLYAMYSPTFAEKGVRLFCPTGADLAKYGLAVPILNEAGEPVKNEKGEDRYEPFAPYRISFSYDVLDENNKYSFTVSQTILLSCPEDPELNPDGSFFGYSAFREFVRNEDGTETPILTYSSNMIVEVAGHSMAFLRWGKSDWVNASYIDSNIAYVDKIEINSPSYNATFDLNNEESSPTADGVTTSTYLKVHATDSAGNDRTTFHYRQFVDVNGYLWLITSDDIRVCDALTGEAKSIKEGIATYGTNKLGQQVLSRTGYIDCKDYDVEVTADAVRVYSNDHSTLLSESIRFDTDLFRDYYEMLVFSTIVNSYEPESEEELAEILSKPLLTVTITTKDKQGTETTTYTFYEITSRKAYITINGNGGFYVYRNRVDKFVSDAQKFFASEPIDPTGRK